MFKIKPVTVSNNPNLQIVSEENKIQNKFYFSKLAKIKQLILLFMINRSLVRGNEFLSINQRALAKNLKTHYNSINTHLQKLKIAGKIYRKSTSNHLEIKLNLSNFRNMELLLLVSQEFSEYLSKRINHKILTENENTSEKRENSSYENKLLEKQISYLSKHKKDLSLKLAKDLVDNFVEANNRTLTVLDKSDYNLLIIKLFENINVYLPEFLISKLPTKIQKNRYRLRAKLNKL
ncbi:MAG: hypothetical protein ACTSSK_00295 [Candidatus Heimdallarchaeota archaeon]